MLRYEDIFEKDIFKRLRDEVEAALASVKKLREELLQIAGALANEAQKKLNEDVVTSIKKYSELSSVIKTYNVVKQEEKKLNDNIRKSLDELTEELQKYSNKSKEVIEEEIRRKKEVRELTSDIKKLLKEEKATK